MLWCVHTIINYVCNNAVRVGAECCCGDALLHSPAAQPQYQQAACDVRALYIIHAARLLLQKPHNRAAIINTQPRFPNNRGCCVTMLTLHTFEIYDTRQYELYHTKITACKVVFLRSPPFELFLRKFQVLLPPFTQHTSCRCAFYKNIVWSNRTAIPWQPTERR